ncbi:heterokaryon incompatibility protein-domain-containing protein, partial [Leptodontidium sp. 2 PMI_412]
MKPSTSSRDAVHSKEKYQYRPIGLPYELRMLELLPGYGDEPVQIRLLHHPLSSLPECEALSYEWGSPERDHEIFCEGKVLKVTSNLLAALKRSRPSGQPVQKPRLLWIDALCINQEDIDERSEQVKLMTEIYRNVGRTLVWIG